MGRLDEGGGGGRGGHSGPKPLMPTLSLKLSSSQEGRREQPKKPISTEQTRNRPSQERGAESRKK